TQDRACNFLSWADGTAYMDWCALRPMTELEFEKACRGTVTPVANEYAWGTATIATSAYTLSNDGAANAGIASNYSATAGNASYSGTDGSINGPVRSGIFAAHSSNAGRITSGATYYGIMEMSGNLFERCVTVGNTTGRIFTGENGNGVLTAAGNADMPNCPGNNASGSGFRGGSWLDSGSIARTSDRGNAADTYSNRYSDYGVRAVRCP
ncbi:MAG: SUMF1/EgtB/PvdO family nonheme iron enzyme, partial [Gammaproteobacteria bacterium]|nr:SUMF1/EgtB/PvdO family nonheme iron enzyme [Gammaproteobacteria bacterium]